MLDEREGSSGPDRILNQMMMYVGRLVEVVLQVINLVLRSESCLTDGKRVLHKDGKNEELGNYSGIALGCNIVKVFLRVIAWRLGRFAEDRILTEAQGRFSSHRRCSDQ